MRLHFLAALLCLLGSPVLHAVTTHPPAPEFTATKLGVIEPEKSLLAIRIASPEGCRIALLTSGSSGQGHLVVIVDGKPGPEFSGILNRTPIFSPDEKRTVYGARIGEQWIVYEDGQTTDPASCPKWDRLLETGFAFSADSKHLAYVARRDKSWYVVADGKENGPYEEITNLPLFSKDGQRLTYGIRKEGRQFMLSPGGEPSPGYEAVGAAVLSPDGHRIAYGAQQDGRQFVILDGKPGERYGGLYGETLQFSADGAHFAYGAEKGARRFVVIDGKEGPDFDGIGRGSLKISPDGKRYAYAARKGEKWVAVVDDQASPTYEKVENLVFSADSRHLAYLAGDETSRFVVLDGKPGPEYLDIVKESIAFSPAGNSLVYNAVQENKTTAVILDGKKLGEYAMVGTPAFSPDGRHVLYRVSVGDQAYIHLDGAPIFGPASLVSEPVFRRDGAIECLQLDGKNLLRIISKPAP